MRIVFMGTPEFAVPSLERLRQDGHEIAAVYTNPDQPKNRGMKLTPSPVKRAAQAAGIPVVQPRSLREDGVAEELASFRPELIVVAAYGKLLPKTVLELPPLGCINVHSSLLPKYRGAAPINWAILNGERESGVTIMEMAPALDAGDILAQRATPIDPEEDAQTLTERLAKMGAELLSETVEHIAAGTAFPTPQDEASHTYAPMLSRALSPIDWTRSAQAIHDQIRGLIPWPVAAFSLQEKTYKAYASVVTGKQTDAPAGTLLGSDREGILFACGDGQILRVTELQAPGKRRMKAADFLRGHKL